MVKKYSLLLILVLVLAFSMIALGYKHIEYHKEADEGFYLSYAKFLDARGISAYPELFKKYIHTREMWIFPNPLRAGYYLLSLAWLKLTGFTFFSLSCISTVFFLLFLTTSFYFSRRYFGDELAVLYTFLLAFSPLNLAMAGRALTESTLVFAQTLAAWLFWLYFQERKKGVLSLLVLTLTAAILIKESSVVLIAVFCGFLVFERFYKKNKVVLSEFAAICLLPPLLFLVSVCALGGAPYIFRTAHIIMTSPEINYYAILFGRGPWYRYLIDFMALSPLVLILSCGFFLQYLVSKKRDGIISYLLFVSLGVFIIFNLFTKNVRYVLFLDVTLRLFAILMLKNICDRYFTKSALPLLFILVMILAAADYLSFYSYFIEGRIYDPSTAALFKANRIVPQEYFYYAIKQ